MFEGTRLGIWCNAEFAQEAITKVKSAAHASVRIHIDEFARATESRQFFARFALRLVDVEGVV